MKGRVTLKYAAFLLPLLFIAAASFTQLPGSETYIGNDTCVTCHEDVAKAYAETRHGKGTIHVSGDRVLCESCHGPGKEHAENEGDKSKIINPKKAEARQANDACLSCHSGDAALYWRGTTHESFNLSCTSCHEVHKPWLADKGLKQQKLNDLCLSCHTDVRKSLHQRSSHPMKDGQMSCASCHDPHGSPEEKSIAALSVNEKCYECHMEKRGPFLWEHMPVRENCMTCHTAHGSNNTKLLSTPAPRLCQSCHLFGHHQTVAGDSGRMWNINRSCVNCHSQIHGSNHPSGKVLMR